VHGGINRIIGMESVVDVADPGGECKGGQAVFVFDGLTSPLPVLDRRGRNQERGNQDAAAQRAE